MAVARSRSPSNKVGSLSKRAWTLRTRSRRDAKGRGRWASVGCLAMLSGLTERHPEATRAPAAQRGRVLYRETVIHREGCIHIASLPVALLVKVRLNVVGQSRDIAPKVATDGTGRVLRIGRERAPRPSRRATICRLLSRGIPHILRPLMAALLSWFDVRVESHRLQRRQLFLSIGSMMSPSSAAQRIVVRFGTGFEFGGNNSRGAGSHDALHSTYPAISQADLDAPRMIASGQQLRHSAGHRSSSGLVGLEHDVDVRAWDHFSCRWYVGHLGVDGKLVPWCVAEDGVCFEAVPQARQWVGRDTPAVELSQGLGMPRHDRHPNCSLVGSVRKTEQMPRLG